MPVYTPIRQLRRLLGFCCATLASAGTLAAQQPMRVTVHGVAYDSLRGGPLDGAFVTMSGSARSTTSDARGNFQFDSVAPGAYTFSMQHDALDSLGISGRAVRATVTDGRDTVRVAIPSFDTFWRSACPGAPPRDSGLVFGTLRRADGGRPVPKATVNATWIDVSYDKEKGVSQRRWHMDIESDARGSFALCGVPTNVATRIHAATDSAASGVIDLAPREDRRIQRRDLLLGGVAAPGAAPPGIIIGKLRDAASSPVGGARVQTDGVPEVRSGTDGSFVIRGLAAGTRQLDVLSIGMAPTSAIVDVAPPDTARIEVQLTKVTTLADVRVTALTLHEVRIRDIEDRKKVFAGRYLDSTAVERHADFRSALSEVMPPRCGATVWIDGVQIKPIDVAGEMRLLSPREIALVEYYPRAAAAPQEFRPVGCGLLLVWTKRWMR